MPASRPVALITGAAKRVGAQIARRLHGAGYDLALHCRASTREITALRDELEAQRSDSTLLLQAELADTAGLPDLLTATLARFGRLDALLNNASAFHPTPLGSATEADWDALRGVAKSPGADTRHAVPERRLPMLTRAPGRAPAPSLRCWRI